jgi:hypothetical protein
MVHPRQKPRAGYGERKNRKRSAWKTLFQLPITGGCNSEAQDLLCLQTKILLLNRLPTRRLAKRPQARMQGTAEENEEVIMYAK